MRVLLLCHTLALVVLTMPVVSQRQLTAAEKPPHVLVAINEDEYGAGETLPAFARVLETRSGCRCTVLDGRGKHEIPGLEALDTADVLVLFARRRGLPPEQMQRLRKYSAAGKPLVALRTASHAFAPGNAAPPGVAQWPAFDAEVLGCHYRGHGPNARGSDVAITAAGHTVLHGVEPAKWHSKSSLYFVAPLDKSATVLLNGAIEGRTEPVAWIRSFNGGRVFYTSLGHRDDFAQPQFQRLLVNAIFWTMDRRIP